MAGGRADPQRVDGRKVDLNLDFVGNGALRERGLRELEAIEIQVQVVRLLCDLRVRNQLRLAETNTRHLIRQLIHVLEQRIINEAGHTPLLGDDDANNRQTGSLNVVVHQTIDVVRVIIRLLRNKPGEQRAQRGVLNQIGRTRDLHVHLAGSTRVQRNRHDGFAKRMDGNQLLFENSQLGTAIQRLVLLTDRKQLNQRRLDTSHVLFWEKIYKPKNLVQSTNKF